MNAYEISSMVELAEMSAYQEMFEAAPAQFAEGVGMKTRRFGSAIAFRAEKIPLILFNRVIGLGLWEEATEQTLDEIIEFYREIGNTFAVQLSPVAQPAELVGWLEARGFKYSDNWAKMYRPAEAAPTIPTRLRLEKIGVEQAEDFARVTIAGFRMPPAMTPWTQSLVGRPNWQHYLAYDEETPVAGGALLVHNGVGWLGLGSTLPTHRKQGGQGSIMARRIQDAEALGCQWVVTETGEDVPENPNPSYHNMVRTGFQLAYQRPNYIMRFGG